MSVPMQEQSDDKNLRLLPTFKNSGKKELQFKTAYLNFCFIEVERQQQLYWRMRKEYSAVCYRTEQK